MLRKYLYSCPDIWATILFLSGKPFCFFWFFSLIISRKMICYSVVAEKACSSKYANPQIWQKENTSLGCNYLIILTGKWWRNVDWTMSKLNTRICLLPIRCLLYENRAIIYPAWDVQVRACLIVDFLRYVCLINEWTNKFVRKELRWLKSRMNLGLKNHNDFLFGSEREEPRRHELRV